MPNILDIGLSGLISHQRSITVAGHNIANAGTEGYSRQSAELTTRPPEFTGSYYLGTGVDVSGVRRSVDEFILTQLRNDTSAFYFSDSLRSQLDQLDQLFANTSSGLSTSQERFFSALQAANDDPTSMTSRAVLLSEAQNLVNKFNGLAKELNSTFNDINQTVEASVDEVNSLAGQIASINAAIVEKSGSGRLGEQPNDLLDERDRMLARLSELIGISTTVQDDGAVNVFIGTGQALVIGAQSLNLVTRQSPQNPQAVELAIQTRSSTIGLGKTGINGGIIGGLLSARDGILTDSINTLGRAALAISDTVNQQHHLGMDLEGNLGGDFFTDINSAAAIASRTVAAANNSSPQDQLVELSVTDLAALTTSDYRIAFTSATTYVVTRLSDQKTNSAIDAGLTGTIGAIPATLQFDGLTLQLDRPSGNFATGDSFLLRPTASAASSMDLALERPEQVALAAPIRTASDLNNQGTGAIGPGVVTDTGVSLFSTTPGQLSPALLIRFTSATTYDILDNSGATPVPLVPPQTGLSYPPVPADALLPAGFGISVAISGNPQAGDVFTIDYNSNGFQDNRNGLLLSGLQSTGILDNGRTSLQGAYGQLLQKVGVATNQARMNSEAGKILLQQSEARRQEVSSVNLDEEAAKLVELEQIYGASAQVINVAISLFDTLLNAVQS